MAGWILHVLILVMGEWVWWVQSLGAPPTLTLHPPTSYRPNGSYKVFREGLNLNLRCQAQGNPTPSFTWMKDGVEVDEDMRNKLDLQLTENPGSSWLGFPRLGRQHQGWYHCIAQNKYGKALSYHTRLHMAELGSTCETSRIKGKQVKADILKLTCCSPISVPVASFMWRVTSLSKTGSVTAAPKPVELTERVHIDQEATLIILDVMPDDVMDRYFECDVTNGFFHQIVKYNVTIMRDEDFDMSRDRVPRLISRSDSPLYVLEGEDVHLYCIFSGRPIPSVTWSKPNENLPPGSVQNSSGLYLQKIHRNSGGLYSCKGSNDRSTEKSIMVNVQYKPKILKQPNDTVVPSGQQVEFPCQAEGEPEASITWSLDGVPVLRDAPPERVKVYENGSLIIHDVCKTHCSGRHSDIMVLQCNASNIHGYELAPATLYVIKKTEIRNPPQNLTISEPLLVLNTMKPINLPCVSSHDSEVRTNTLWLHNSDEINYSIPPWYSRYGDSLVIHLQGLSKSQVEDLAGIYTCLVSSPYDEARAEASIFIEVLDEPVTEGNENSSDVYAAFENSTKQSEEIDFGGSMLGIETRQASDSDDDDDDDDDGGGDDTDADDNEGGEFTAAAEEAAVMEGSEESEEGLVGSIIFLVGASIGIAIFIISIVLLGFCVRRCRRKQRELPLNTSTMKRSSANMYTSQYWRSKDEISFCKRADTLMSLSFSDGGTNPESPPGYFPPRFPEEEPDDMELPPPPPPPEEEDQPLPPPPLELVSSLHPYSFTSKHDLL